MSRSTDRRDPSGEIERLLSRFPADSPGAEHAGAAVLILLRAGRPPGGPETLLIQRTERPEDAASGQVSLPGGRVGPADTLLRDTALRESWEEVGISAPDLAGSPRFVGVRRASAFDLEVGVFAAGLGTAASAPHTRSRHEVASVFWLPRQNLEATENIPRATTLGPREVEATVYEGHIVWGFTRRLLRDFFGLDGRGAADTGPRNSSGTLGGPARAREP